MSIVAIALLGILLLVALVAFGLGQGRWHWASVAASFLLVLTLGGYLYLAARLLAYEWNWAQTVRSKQVRLHDLEYSRQAGPDGELADMSLETLAQVRNRWQRALDSVDTWRGRRWEHASFSPPAADGETGTLQLPAPPRDPATEGDPSADPGAAAPAGAAASAPGVPLDPGMIVYLFDDTPFKDGGRYLGSFIIEAIEPSEDGGQSVQVRQTAARDRFDSEAWEHDYDNVSVFDRLPTDRWAAFSSTPTDLREPAEAGGDVSARGAGVAPAPQRPTADTIEELVAEQFRPGMHRHALNAADAPEPIEQTEWAGLRDAIEAGSLLPGEYWALATFSDRVDRDAFLGIEGSPSDELTVEMELTTAYELQDEGKATIKQVLYRRRLLDAETLVHGSIMPGGDILADGLAGMMRSLKRDIAAVEASNQQLEASQQSANAERDVLNRQADELSADLTNWARDLAAATRTAEAFATAAASASQQLAKTEEQVVTLGRALDAEVGQAVEEIDLAAPPPGGRAAGRPAASF
jgi:FtsZ-binding cell division protein ZapB